MYLLDLCVSYSIFLAIFSAHNGSREGLNLYSWITHNYLISTKKEIAIGHLTVHLILLLYLYQEWCSCAKLFLL